MAIYRSLLAEAGIRPLIGTLYPLLLLAKSGIRSLGRTWYSLFLLAEAGVRSLGGTRYPWQSIEAYWLKLVSDH